MLRRTLSQLGWIADWRIHPTALAIMAIFLFSQNVANAAVAYGSRGNAVSGTTSLSVPYPGSIVAGNLLILIVGNKYPTNGPATPSGWTLVANGQGSGGLGSAGSDSGGVYNTIFVKEALGTESGNLAVTVSSANTSMARMFLYTKAAGTTWNYAATNGSDNSAGTTWSITGATNPGITSGDVLVVGSSLNGNQVSNWAESISATGVTFGVTNERNDSTSSTGDDMGLIVSEHPVTAGTASSAPVFTMTGATGSAVANSPTGASVILRIREVVPPTTTIATGSDPMAATIAPGTAATDVNLFTLQTSSGSETVSSVTVNLSISSGIGLLAITDNAGTVLGSTASPVTGSNTISVAGMTATTTLTTFKVRVTPLSHVLMPVPPGAAYAVSSPVTAWGGSNTHAGSDTNTNALTIDNLSPTSATATSGTAGNASITLGWTTSASTDFSTTGGSVVYRWTTVGSEHPVEGSTPSVPNPDGAATVVCVLDSPAPSTAVIGIINGTGGSSGCSTTALLTGTAYTYKVFQKDSNGNYDTGVTIGPITIPGAVSASLSTVVTDSGNVVSDGLTPATITVTLKDSLGTPVPGKVVTLAANMGSSVITTVSGTTNASGVATFQVKDATIEGPITYTATDVTDSIVIMQTVQVEFLVCFSDNFDRVSLLSTSNWTRTKSGGTTYDADIVNNRLRLTDANTNEATAVHLRRLFPGFGNKVEAMFDYFSYNGTGADGVALTLSDASIAPAAGAYGGSLGYAQRTSPTVVDGFTGGWMGVGLDEYGNYSNPTEGRVGGTGFFPDNLTIRGSGSGQSGYNYHTRAAVPGGVDSPGAAAGPGYRYKITVDHSDSIHAKTTVLRDTNGDGIYEQTIIPEYDAKAIPTQATVPTYWNFSFTGSTGASTNIHEIDNLTICTVNPIVTPVLNHVRIIHDGSALTCAPETITIKACATADCQALYTGPVTVDLTASNGTWSSDPVTFSGGQAMVTLSYASTGGVTLGGSVTAPSSMTAVCYNGSTSGNCSLTYSSNACAFDAVETGKNPSTPIFTKLAGTPFTVDVLALTAGAINTGFTGAVTVDLVDQTGVAAGLCGTTSLASPISPTSPYTFVSGNSGRKTFTFNYANAAKDVRVRMVRSGITACSSDNFAIRPTSFSVTSPNANNTAMTGTPIIKAGSAFELDAASVNNYTGTALINNNRVVAHSGAVQSGTVGGTFSAATLASSWVSKGMAFTYSEVGNFHFTPWGVYDDGSFVDVDRSKSTPECVVDNKLGTIVDPTDPNVIDLNGKYGCYFGGTNTVGGTITSPYFGRFTPDHLAITSGTVGPGCGTFTYFGQDGFSSAAFTLTAENSSNSTTKNYEGGYAKLALTTWVNFGFTVTNPPAGSVLSAGTPAPTGSWTSGVATVTAKHQLSRPAALTGETNVVVQAKPVDSDGVTMTAANVAPSTPLRYGRLTVQNAYGSELLDLPMPLTAEYWNGNSWITNAADSCTALIKPADGSGLVLNLAYTGTTTSTLSNPLVSGDAGFSLAAPGATHTGNVDITINSPAWLDFNWKGTGDTDPTARATFGIYRGNSRFIYIRELY